MCRSWGYAVPNGIKHRWPTDGQTLLSIAFAFGMGVAIARLPLWAAVGILVAAAIVLVALIQPFVALALALLTGPLGALENVILGTDIPESGQLTFLLLAGVWLARGLRRRRVYLLPTKVGGPLALFVGVAAISLLKAPSLSYGLKELTKWLEMGLTVVIIADLATSGHSKAPIRAMGSAKLQARLFHRRFPLAAHSILAILLLVGLSQALIGIWQFGIRGDGPEHFSILGRFYRAYGSFEQPNPYGGLMAIGASLAIGSLLGFGMQLLTGDIDERRLRFGTSTLPGEPGSAMEYPVTPAGKRAGISAVFAKWARRQTRADWIWLAFVGGSGATMSLALLFSWSRGAWIGFAGAIAVLVLFLPKRRWLGLMLFLLLAGFVLMSIQGDVLPETVTSRVAGFGEDLRFGDVRGVDINDENYAVLERLAHWQVALEMARDNLWLGVGFGNYEPAYGQYALLNWPDALGHAHNYYLNILAETGLLGGLAYLLFWAIVFWQAFGLLGRLSWPQRGIALGLVAAWTSLALHHLVDKLYVNNLYIFFGAMLGMQQVLDKTDD